MYSGEWLAWCGRWVAITIYKDCKMEKENYIPTFNYQMTCKGSYTKIIDVAEPTKINQVGDIVANEIYGTWNGSYDAVMQMITEAMGAIDEDITEVNLIVNIPQWDNIGYEALFIKMAKAVNVNLSFAFNAKLIKSVEG